MAASAEAPREFTAEDFASRVARAVEQAPEAGLDGVVVAPAPDLVWLTGHQPRQGPGARHGRLLAEGEDGVLDLAAAGATAIALAAGVILGQYLAQPNQAGRAAVGEPPGRSPARRSPAQATGQSTR